MAAVLFGVAAFGLIASAVLLVSTVSRGRALAEASGVSALLVDDRVQIVLSQLNTASPAAPEARIVTGWMDSDGNPLSPAQADDVQDKTNLTVIAQSPANAYRITVSIEATAGHDSSASRTVTLRTIDTDGAITSVDAHGRPAYVPNTGRSLPALPAAGLLWEVAP